MKWETVKSTVAREAFTQVQTNWAHWANILTDLVASDFAAKRGHPDHTLITDYANAVYERIMNWDIRLVGKLRELFPHQFPKSLSNGELVCEYDENCNWCVNKRLTFPTNSARVWKQ